jgi:cytochrome c oxidase cbb3-type subunit 3
MKFLLCLGLVLIAGCEREDRRLNSQQPHGPQQMVSQVSLQPGPTRIADTVEGPYDDNAPGTAEGQLLFSQMNCSGCHANGGGGMGPALMDDKWIYGSRPDQIFASIAEGRPNGMPTWKYRLTDKQIWQLVAFVRSLSGLTPKGARPSRDDHMMVKPAAAQTPNAKPKNHP